MPALAFFKDDRIVRFFVLAILIMSTLYGVGYFFNIYGLGRIISPVIIFSDFLIAYTLYIFWVQKKNIFNVYFLLVVFALAVSLGINIGLLKRTISFAERNTTYYTKFNALKNVVKENETILSDIKTSLFIPSFQGKVIAVSYPLYWINDIDKRRKNVWTFFTNGTNDSTRLNILKKYQPDFILIDYASITPTVDDIEFYRSLGKSVYRKDDLELIRVEK
jgi:hypothetical protein